MACGKNYYDDLLAKGLYRGLRGQSVAFACRHSSDGHRVLRCEMFGCCTNKAGKPKGAGCRCAEGALGMQTPQQCKHKALVLQVKILKPRANQMRKGWGHPRETKNLDWNRAEVVD